MAESSFTPEQIQEILNNYFENFAHRQYIGQRYVPIFGRKDEESIIWDNTGTYEPLTIVLYQGNSYTSRQFVPVGVDITNQSYWANTGNYNAQIESYRQEVLTFDNRISDIEEKFPLTASDIADGAVTTIKVMDGAVTDDKINDDAVTTNKIIDGAVTEGKIANNAVTTNKIIDGAVTDDKIADDAVTTNKIIDGAITADKLADNAILDIIKNDTFFLTPEMFGAQGYGADDTQAFQDMFDAATDRNTCVLTKRSYTIKNTVNITNSYITLIGLGNSGITPNVHFDFTDGSFNYGFNITGSSFHTENIDYNFSDRVAGTYLLYFNPQDSNVDANINSCTFGYAYNHILVNGRNISVRDSLFSSWSGTAITIADAQISNMRGYNFRDNRFHSGHDCIDASAITQYTGVFNITVNNNFCDGCSYLYFGISDGVSITNNKYFQHSGDSQYPIYFTKTLATTSHNTCVVSNNIFNDLIAGTRLQGMVVLGSTNCSGVFAIMNNFFDSQLQESHAVIVVRGSSAYTTIVNIIGNIIRTSSTGTPIQVVTNDPMLTGYITGNVIKSNSTNYITPGSLTVGQNYTL